MNVYAESSAILSWLFGEARASDVRHCLRNAQTILASDLTLVECERVIIRARTLGEVTDQRAGVCRHRLIEAAACWHVLRVSASVVSRAREPLPQEPIRTLDALHLTSALVGRSAVRDLAFLSLDARIRSAASNLGFSVLPD